MALLTVGVTGKNGFIGCHLLNTLRLHTDEFAIVPFERNWFDDSAALDSFVTSCDVIIHLAALNRHNEQDVIYCTNTELVEKIVAALERTKVKPHVLLSSSTQEENDTLYGKSKREGREQLAQWAAATNAIFTGMVIPNVFGPFGHPNYNSVIATFCHKISREEETTIQVDGLLKLLYVGDLITTILTCIRNKTNNSYFRVAHSTELKVTELRTKLLEYKTAYQDKGEIPNLATLFDYQLFNTYRCYMDIATYFPRKFVQHNDSRGSFSEIIRTAIGGQFSFSTTNPGVTRGNHFHTRKIERFAVIKGKALIQLRIVGTDEVYDFYLDGAIPAYVDMPIWFTHNIKNIGDDVLYTNFWINEPYNPEDADTWFENV